MLQSLHHLHSLQRPPSATARANGLSPTKGPLDLLPIITLVLWLLPLAIGIAGLRLPYPPPVSSSAAPPPKTQIVNVQIPEPPPPPPESVPPILTEAPPPTPDAPPAPSIPEIPQPIPVALPSPAIAFALPVEGYTKIVDINQAAHGRPAVASTHPSSTGSQHAPGNAPPAPTAQFANPPVTRLTFGEGEGNQPAPDYPREAITAQQEGTVTIRFTVDETGSVTKTDVTNPSRWPVLNRAAAKTIKDHWHFPPGPPRTYEVPIQFQLNQ